LQSGEGAAGRAKTGPNPTDRGRSGSKHCLLTDASGAPLVLQLAAANRHDVNMLLPLVLDIPPVAGKPGRPKQKPEAVVADKAFDCQALRDLLRWLGIEPLPRRPSSLPQPRRRRHLLPTLDSSMLVLSPGSYASRQMLGQTVS
jgi:hypothetical protein